MMKVKRHCRAATKLCLSLLCYIPVRQKNFAANWPKQCWILGHRGAQCSAAENTVSGFLRAIEWGADGVEFDVVPSRDGIPMVIHDDTLERTTDGSGTVWHHDATTLMELNATKLMKSAQKEGVPTLEASLRALPDNVIVNVELKSHGHLTKEDFIRSVMPIIEAHRRRVCMLVSSFDGELLKLVRQREPDLLVALLLAPNDTHWPSSLKYLRQIKPDALHLPPELATRIVGMLARFARMHLAIWTINDPLRAKSFFTRGIAGIFTDRVSDIVKEIRKDRKR